MTEASGAGALQRIANAAMAHNVSARVRLDLTGGYAAEVGYKYRKAAKLALQTTAIVVEYHPGPGHAPGAPARRDPGS